MNPPVVRLPRDLDRKPKGFVSTNSVGWPIKMIKADLAHQKGATAKGVKIAVGDTGTNFEHPNLPTPIFHWFDSTIHLSLIHI